MTTTTAPATTTTRTMPWVLVWGAALGFTLGMVGFGDFAELNAMFTLQDWRMIFAFGGGVTLAAIGFVTIVGKDRLPANQPIHRWVVPGAVLFGAGWAISGGCPAIPIVQVATGYVPGLVTLAGIATGMRLFRVMNARWLRIDSGSCSL